MDGLDLRRKLLSLVVRQPSWRPMAESREGEILKELEAMDWVVLVEENGAYSCELTERGLERHQLWGDERRQRARVSDDESGSDQGWEERPAA